MSGCLARFGRKVLRKAPFGISGKIGPRRAHRALRALRLGRPDASLVLHRLPRTFHDGIQLLDVRIVILERLKLARAFSGSAL